MTPLKGLDVFMGGFCVFMLAMALIAWRRGEVSPRTPVVIGVFLIANIVISQLSVRARNFHAVELLRIVAGTIIAPLAFLGADGRLALWWPGFLIMALGGTIMHGLITQKPFWGFVIVGYYVALLLGVSLASDAPMDWYAFALHAGVIAMTGLTFAQIMSLLGQSLQKEHERSRELKAARDSLFAEMEVAQEIQTLLLPRAPTLPDNVVDGRMYPASEVGGDYYDVIEAAGRRQMLAIGDVSGHGVASGLTMMMARSSLVGILEANPEASLAEIYCLLNRCIRRNLERMDIDMYMTFALFEYRGRGQFAAVGRHLPIMIYRQHDGSVEELELQGMWLGVLDELDPAQVPPVTFALHPGDQLFLYTDGIVEHDVGAGMFGFDRLKQVIATHAPKGSQALIGNVMQELEAHGKQFSDDVTMLVVDHRGDVVGRSAAIP